MKKLLMLAVIGIMVLGLSGTARAIVLVPGTGNTGITGALPPDGYGVLQTSLVMPFSFGLGPMTGTVTETVYLNSIGMLFVYDVARDVNADSGQISRLTASDFTGFTVDANYDNTTAGTRYPFSVDRHTADVVGFDFDPGVGSGELVQRIWIQTDAPKYKPGFVSLINGRTIDLNGLGPAVIPEPMTSLLLGMGALGLFGLRRKNS